MLYAVWDGDGCSDEIQRMQTGESWITNDRSIERNEATLSNQESNREEDKRSPNRAKTKEIDQVSQTIQSASQTNQWRNACLMEEFGFGVCAYRRAV